MGVGHDGDCCHENVENVPSVTTAPDETSVAAVSTRVNEPQGLRLNVDSVRKVSELCRRPFTLEVSYANKSSSRVSSSPDWCSASELLKRDVKGEHIFLHPPSYLEEVCLQHVNRAWKDKPYTTSCVAVLPDLKRRSKRGNPLVGWSKLHTFTRGSKVLEQEVNGKYVAKGRLTMPMSLWYLGPLATGSPLCVNAAETRHPTFVCQGYAAGLRVTCGVTDEDITGVDVESKVLLDTGATDAFVNVEWLRRAGYDLETCLKPCKLVVRLADKSETTSRGRIDLPLKLGSYRGKVRLIALDLGDGYDVILGDSWLREHKARIDYDKMACIVKAQNRVCVIHPWKSQESQPRSLPKSKAVLSALQAKRAVRKAEELFWVVIKKSKGNELNAMSLDQVDWSFLDTIEDPDLKKLLEKFKRVFGPIPPGLPRDRGIGHTIGLEPGVEAPWRAIFRMSPPEKEELAKQIKEMLAAGWIEPSSSPFGAPVLFVKKKDGSLRLVIDYRALNKVTIKNRYPLPRIDDLLDCVGKAKYFSSLDLASGYHQIRINEEDVPKTAFRTPMGHYQWRVLSMGLCNAPSTFQKVMDSVFKRLIGKSVVVYLDDILIFSKTREEHMVHLEQVLRILEDEKLHCKFKKCEFLKNEVKFLGHIIDNQGIKPDPAKVECVKAWTRPKNVHELRSFLGLTNYFRKFIKGYALYTYPLTQLLKREAFKKPEVWGDLEEKAFQEVKEQLVHAPVLAHYDPAKPIELVCDASKYALGGVLLQEGRPVAFESRKLNPAETRYSTGDREMLAVVHCLRVWRCYLQGVPFTLVTDHKPNTYFKDLDRMSDRQIRWAEKLERFSYTWEYRKGEANVADPLSRLCVVATLTMKCENSHGVLRDNPSCWRRKSPDARCLTLPSRDEPLIAAITRRMSREAGVTNPIGGEGATAENPEQAQDDGDGMTSDEEFDQGPPLQEDESPETKAFQRRLEKSKVSMEQLQKAYKSESWAREVERSREKFTRRANGLWYMGDKIVVPSGPLHRVLRMSILQEYHEPKFVGHPGFDRMIKSVGQKFWWQGMRAEVQEFCKGCTECARNKASTRRKPGQYQIAEVPDTPWHTVHMDFITDLPVTNEGHDAIAVFVDRLTKMVHFVPTRMQGLTAEKLAGLFIDRVFVHHGVPSVIVSDRDTRMTAAFWRTVMKRLGSQSHFTTAFHPKANGQTERYNRVLEEMLRMYISPSMTDWATHLATCEFAVNSHEHKATGFTPFYLNYGRNPRRPIDVTLEGDTEESSKEWHENLQFSLKRAHENLCEAYRAVKEREDKGRPVVSYQVGQQVWLSSKNFSFKAGVSKLMPRYLGPFKVNAALGPVTYRLGLPEDWKLHDVFHVSLLKPFLKDERYKSPKPVRIVDGMPEWEVDEIVAHRISERKIGSNQVPTRRVQYLVHWTGFGREYQSWIPEANVQRCQRLVEDYWKRLARTPESNVDTMSDSSLLQVRYL